MFGEKYGDEVRVVDYSGVSMELCGGGRPNFAQAGGRDASKLPEAMAAAEAQLKEALKG